MTQSFAVVARNDFNGGVTTTIMAVSTVLVNAVLDGVITNDQADAIIKEADVIMEAVQDSYDPDADFVELMICPTTSDGSQPQLPLGA